MKMPFPYYDLHSFIFSQSLTFVDRHRRKPFFREIEKLDPEIREKLKEVKSSDLNIRPDLVW